ncbi:MAG TPA: hypothetical protein VHX49_08570 [Candidatus Acidoferrales bacterium]|jgi:hypothetical protein|nr:hypothetical protein [Candidatus Acidoferrales bacterium]
MRFVARYCCVLCAAALILPAAAQAGQRVQHKVVGVVSQTDHGHVDSADATSGANVYDCDTLEADQGGQMRLQVQSGQVYVASGSEGQLQGGFNGIDVYISRGTVGFATIAGGAIEIVTPAGYVRAANGQAASGEVTITGPTEMLISATRGDLVLENGGALQTIPQGKTAKVAFAEGSAPACHEEDDTQNQQQNQKAFRRPLAFYLIPAAAVAVPAILLFHYESESKYKP